MFRLASLSNMPATTGNKAVASVLSVNPRSLRTALRAVLCWYLLSTRFASFERIRLMDDL